MRFWTAFGTESNGRYNWRHRNTFPFSVGGKLESKRVTAELINDTPSVVAMVDAYAEDLANVGNALVYQVNDRSTVLVPPKLCDSGRWLAIRSTGRPHWPDWAEVHKDSVHLIRDGKACGTCDDCPNIIRRAAGACIPGLINCTQKFFSEDARMTVPNLDMYLPQSKCCERVAFQSYDFRKLVPDTTLGSPITVVRHSATTRSAITSRRIRELSCAVCMFGNSGKCSGGIRGNRCHGPFFESDIPEPSKEQRMAFSLLGTRIPFEKYMSAAKKNGWVSKKWRTEFDIHVGVPKSSHAGFFPVLRAYGRRMGAVALTEPKNWLAVMQEFELTYPTLTEPPTPLEKLIILGITSGHLLRGPNRGFGYSSCLNTVYHEGGTERLLYSMVAFSFNQRCRDHQCLLSYHPGMAWNLDVHRGEALRAILDKEKPGENVQLRVCREVIGDMVEHARSGLAIPPIDTLGHDCAKRVAAKQEKWAPAKAPRRKKKAKTLTEVFSAT
jgi:hypothetical protein